MKQAGNLRFPEAAEYNGRAKCADLRYLVVSRASDTKRLAAILSDTNLTMKIQFDSNQKYQLGELWSSRGG